MFKALTEFSIEAFFFLKRPLILLPSYSLLSTPLLLVFAAIHLLRLSLRPAQDLIKGLVLLKTQHQVNFVMQCKLALVLNLFNLGLTWL